MAQTVLTITNRLDSYGFSTTTIDGHSVDALSQVNQIL